MEKYLIWHIEGGLGKNVAATALCKDIKEKYPDRKFILVCSWAEIFLNNPYIDRVYSVNNRPHFYEDYIENKDVIIFKQEAYNQTGHITKTKHLIENWCDILDIKYNNQLPFIFVNYAQSKFPLKWRRNKPTLLLQTTGGSFLKEQNPSPYSWTRDLPIELAQSIVDKYSNNYHIIQVTRESGYQLNNVERLDIPLENTDLFALVASSQKRILIDSCLQHFSAALNLKSNVFWIGTSPKIFGYNIHNNIISKKTKIANQLINSYTFDFDFSNNTHECPYMSLNEMFDIKEILNQLGN